jgi:hypothetical protein
MTEAERQEITAAAVDAERLRNDPALKRALLSLRASKVSEMEREQANVITALLNGEPANIETVRTLKAEIKAIDGFCQELATAILRAPRKPLAVA